MHQENYAKGWLYLSVSRQWLQNSSIWYPGNRLQTLTERRHFCTCHKCWHILIFVLGGKYPSVLTFVSHIVTHAYCQELLQNWSDPVYMFNCRLLLSFASWGKASGQKSCSVLSNMITADLMCYCFYTGWQFAYTNNFQCSSCESFALVLKLNGHMGVTAASPQQRE